MVSLDEGKKAQSTLESGGRGSRSQISAIPAWGLTHSPRAYSRAHAFQWVCNENSLGSPCGSARVRGSLERQEWLYSSAPHPRSNRAASGQVRGQRGGALPLGQSSIAQNSTWDALGSHSLFGVETSQTFARRGESIFLGNARKEAARASMSLLWKQKLTLWAHRPPFGIACGAGGKGGDYKNMWE